MIVGRIGPGCLWFSSWGSAWLSRVQHDLLFIWMDGIPKVHCAMAAVDSNMVFKVITAGLFATGAGMATYASVMAAYKDDRISDTSEHDYESDIMQYGEIGSYMLVAVFALLLVEYATKGFKDFAMKEAEPKNALVSGILLFALVISIVQGAFYTMARDENSEFTGKRFDEHTPRALTDFVVPQLFLALGLLPIAHRGISNGRQNEKSDEKDSDMVDKLFATLGGGCVMLFSIAFTIYPHFAKNEEFQDVVGDDGIFEDFAGQRGADKALAVVSVIFSGLAALFYFGIWFKRLFEQDWANVYRSTFMAIGLGACSVYTGMHAIQRFEYVEAYKNAYDALRVYISDADTTDTLPNHFTGWKAQNPEPPTWTKYQEVLSDQEGEGFYSAAAMFLPVCLLPLHARCAAAHPFTALLLWCASLCAQRDVQQNHPGPHVQVDGEGCHGLRQLRQADDDHVLDPRTRDSFNVNTHPTNSPYNGQCLLCPPSMRPSCCTWHAIPTA